MIILEVKRRSWIVGVSVMGSFEFCSIYFLPTISTDDSLALNFGKEVEYTL